MSQPDTWSFWDALTNANPDWWDSNNDDEDGNPDEDLEEEEVDQDAESQL